MGGNWIVQTAFTGSRLLYDSSGGTLKFNVGPPSFLSQYSMYIFVGAGAGVGIIAFVYFRRRRG